MTLPLQPLRQAAHSQTADHFKRSDRGEDEEILTDTPSAWNFYLVLGLSVFFRRPILALVQFIRLSWGSWIKPGRYAKKKQTSNQRECSVCLHLPLKDSSASTTFVVRLPSWRMRDRGLSAEGNGIQPCGSDWSCCLPCAVSGQAVPAFLLLLLLTVSRLSQECRLKIFSACFRPSTFSHSWAEASDKQLTWWLELTYLVNGCTGGWT